MTRALLLAALVALSAWQPAGAAVTCRSGVELYEQDGVRIFETRGRGHVPTWWACSARVRAPRKLAGLSPGVTNELVVAGRQGRRLAFAIESFADGGGGWRAGWFDVRSGRVARGGVDRASGADFTNAPRGLRVDRSGAIAYVLSRYDDEDDEIGRDLIHRSYTEGRFGTERILASLAPAEIEVETIGFADGAITWRTVGAERSTPLETASPAAAAAAAAGEACRRGRTLYHYGARVFTTRRGTFACHRDRAARVSLKKVRPRNYVETRRYLAFTAAGRLFRFDLATGRLRSGELAGTVLKVAQAGGNTAAATAAGPIFLLPAKGPLRELAALEPAEIEPATLRLTARDARWRERGQPRSLAY